MTPQNSPQIPGEPLRAKEIPDNHLRLSSEAAKPENFGKSDKLEIFLSYDRKGQLKVQLHVPLDSNYPDEARAAELDIIHYDGDEKYVDVIYDVNIDLDAEMAGLSEGIQDLFKTAAGKAMQQGKMAVLSEAQKNQALSTLAELGRSIFNNLFEDIDINFSDDDKIIVLAAIKSAFTHSQVLDIRGPRPLYPWAFLYNHENYDSQHPNPEGFWGFKHEIQEQYTCTSQTLHLPLSYRILSAVCTIVDSEGWHTKSTHPLVVLKERVDDISTEQELGRALGDFHWDCLYFFGHADHAKQPIQATSWLQLRNQNLTVTKMKQDYKAPKFKNNLVIAFLNGCGTSALSDWDKNTVVGYLCETGDRKVCCVAAVDSIPPALAAEFAKYFWTYFLCDMKPIGLSLLDARREILKQFNNPLGLLYSLFGRADTRVHEKATGCSKALIPDPVVNQEQLNA